MSEERRYPRPLADIQYDRAVRWLKSPRNQGRKPPRHIAEKIAAQRKWLEHTGLLPRQAA